MKNYVNNGLAVALFTQFVEKNQELFKAYQDFVKRELFYNLTIDCMVRSLLVNKKHEIILEISYSTSFYSKEAKGWMLKLEYNLTKNTLVGIARNSELDIVNVHPMTVDDLIIRLQNYSVVQFENLYAPQLEIVPY